MRVESLKINDKKQWCELYQGYADFYKMPMNDDILDTVWSWIFDEENKFYAIGARSSQGNLVGFMHFREMPSPLRGSLIGFLDDLYVHPDHRGSGVVQSLFKELKSLAERKIGRMLGGLLQVIIIGREQFMIRFQEQSIL